MFESGYSHCPQIGISVNNQNRMANSVDPDEMAHYETSHQDLNCLQKKMV